MGFVVCSVLYHRIGGSPAVVAFKPTRAFFSTRLFLLFFFSSKIFLFRFLECGREFARVTAAEQHAAPAESRHESRG